MEGPSDEMLMDAYVRGDSHAFEQLFARLAPRLHRFFLRSFGAKATADDLLQQTFLKLHRARASYKPDMKLAPWAFAIAARVRLDEFRSRKRLAEDGDEEALARADEALAAAAEDRDRERDARLDATGTDLVRRAVDALPESQRVVVHLNRYEGMTFADIARVLGTTEGAIKLRAFRAYGSLRNKLAPLVTGAGEEGGEAAASAATPRRQERP
jgi:RNA polymerase sigma-70 factor, ECF subfamily